MIQPIANKPVYNYHTFVHGPNSTSSINGYYGIRTFGPDVYSQNISGYEIIDVGNAYIFNPTPMFIPNTGTFSVLAIALALVLKRRRITKNVL